MRSYAMYDFTRGLTLALVVGLARRSDYGVQAQIGTTTTGRFWLAMAVVAGAGFIVALATHVGTVRPKPVSGCACRRRRSS